MTLQPSPGCSYTGGGTPRASVVLSVTHDGAICREGGPARQVIGGATLDMENLRLCNSGGFEVDDAFQSEVVASANDDGSWTFYESRQSASRARETPKTEPAISDTTPLAQTFPACMEGVRCTSGPVECFDGSFRAGGGIFMGNVPTIRPAVVLMEAPPFVP